MDLIGYFASFLMGVILGLIGGGGSILTVPIMVYLFGISPTIATGNSLFIVGLTALVGSIMYIRRGDINFKVGITFAIPSMIGVNLSRGLIIPRIPAVIATINGFSFTKEILIMATFAILMIAASYSMIKKKREQKPQEKTAIHRSLLIAIQGLMVGLIAGFVGAGGGFLIIPALVVFAGLAMKKAVGTSLMIIAIQSLLGFAGDVSRGSSFDWRLLTTVAAIAILGIFIGFTTAGKVKEQKLKSAFGWFVLVMGTLILIEQIHRLSS